MTFCHWGSWSNSLCKAVVFPSDAGVWSPQGGQLGREGRHRRVEQGQKNPQRQRGAHVSDSPPASNFEDVASATSVKELSHTWRSQREKRSSGEAGPEVGSACELRQPLHAPHRPAECKPPLGPDSTPAFPIWCKMSLIAQPNWGGILGNALQLELAHYKATTSLPLYKLASLRENSFTSSEKWKV